MRRSALGTLNAVLGALAVTSCLVSARRTCRARGVESSANHVITNTRKVLHTTTTNEHNAVLLEVVAFTGDVTDHFHTVGETNTAHLTKRGVRLLGGRGVNAHAYAALLRAGTKCRRVGASLL